MLQQAEFVRVKLMVGGQLGGRGWLSQWLEAGPGMKTKVIEGPGLAHLDRLLKGVI